MNGERKGNWAVVLPIYFSVYHFIAVVFVIASHMQQALLVVELPVAPLMILLLLMADKGLISPPNALAIPILFFSTLVLWIFYGVIIGRWIDRKEAKKAAAGAKDA